MGVLIIFQSCNKEDQISTCENCNFTCLEMNELNVVTNNCIDNWECEFKVTTKSRVDLDESEGKGNGDKNLFQVINHTDGDLSVIDDELTNILVFELDESQNSFSVEDDELEYINTHFKQVCYCPVSFKLAKSGCIQGEKQADGTWLIQGNLNLPSVADDYEFRFDAIFRN